jgi:hypothetical protein
MVTIGEEIMSDEFRKLHLMGLPFDAVIHEFVAVDKGDPHCHPFSFRTHILYGSYVELRYFINPDGTWYGRSFHRKEGDSFIVNA